MTTKKSNYRSKVKGAIHSAGYPTIKEFTKKNKINAVALSLVLNYRANPTPGFLEKFARGIGQQVEDVEKLFS